MTYYLADGEQQKGPFPVELLLSQGLRPESMVWCTGMPQWERADRVEELKSLFWHTSTGSPPPFGARAASGGYVADVFADVFPKQGSYQQAGGYPNPGTAYANPGTFAGSSPGINYQGPGLPPRDINGTKIAAGICAILFGPFGVHKFIIGATGAGITMILVSFLTLGLGAIVMHVIGIIEGIIYLTKPDAEFYQTYIVGKKAWF